ncbi:NAD(P)/FAD-dependent oxidoreductase [Tahibacter amnicola]|uniref:NADH:ubiquinone reductase (non-electrogenic) n=1 Tax=Tahibacter amnicola TaxID=2976241 RepID=A0ABY6BID8_9GAMM|nr:NAD(P)/FAD-dependent oxidoreductase [Tahibacter amnicola]UXI69118.1 NAD(P)/FAD-dependent oxidoreductase [Tahibacter amnicola]
MNNKEVPHVVIVGGGFGGLWAAREFRRDAVRITLIDRNNHHLFQPLLYQVATAGLSSPDIAAPLRHILRRQGNVTVLMDEVSGIEPATKQIRLAAGGSLGYDYLILASGARHAYFGRDEWASHAPGLKTLDDALAIRRRILTAFERAEAEVDPERRRAWLNFVVIGGGPTGVELAGTLAEIARHTLRREFRRADPTRARIVLVEAGTRVLSTLPEPLSQKARQQLERLGVEVQTGAPVTAVDADGISLGDERIEARTVLWAAGVAASPLGRSLGVSLDRAGRVPVASDLRVPGHDAVFVIGDLATLSVDGKPVPGVAPAAKQMGTHAARMIRRLIGGQSTSGFRYRDFGNLATIGRWAAVADLGRVRLSGMVAWLFWLFIHILFLIGFRSRLIVLINWAWSYWTYQRHARIIVGTEPGETRPAADTDAVNRERVEPAGADPRRKTAAAP